MDADPARVRRALRSPPASVYGNAERIYKLNINQKRRILANRWPSPTAMSQRRAGSAGSHLHAEETAGGDRS